MTLTLLLGFCDPGRFSVSLSSLIRLVLHTVPPAVFRGLAAGFLVGFCSRFIGVLVVVPAAVHGADGIERRDSGLLGCCVRVFFTIIRSLRERVELSAGLRSVLSLEEGEAVNEEESQSTLLRCSWPIRADTEGEFWEAGEHWAGISGDGGESGCGGFWVDPLDKTASGSVSVCRDI